MREPNYTFRTRVARLGRTAWAGVRSVGDEAERLVSCSVDTPQEMQRSPLTSTREPLRNAIRSLPLQRFITAPPRARAFDL